MVEVTKESVFGLHFCGSPYRGWLTKLVYTYGQHGYKEKRPSCDDRSVGHALPHLPTSFSKCLWSSAPSNGPQIAITCSMEYRDRVPLDGVPLDQVPLGGVPGWSSVLLDRVP